MARTASILTSWHIITGEYPPQPGGVSDYTRNVARGLAGAGDRVHVWAPACPHPDPDDAGIVVHRGSRAVPRGSLMLVQYVPHAYGWKAMNVPFCVWLWWRSRRNRVSIMFHEVAMPVSLGQPLTHSIRGVVHRAMAWIVVRSAERIWVSIPAWEQLLRSISPRLPPVEWLLVPSNIPIAPHTVQRHAGTRIGHFGTYGAAIAAMLRVQIPAILERVPDTTVILMGRGSQEFAAELAKAQPGLRARLETTGALTPEDLSRQIAGCDFMVQPFAQGVSSRNTSVSAALEHGRPVITNAGPFTEPFWYTSPAVVLARDVDAVVTAVRDLSRDPEKREQMGVQAAELYRERFHLRHTIAALRAAAGGLRACESPS